MKRRDVIKYALSVPLLPLIVGCDMGSDNGGLQKSATSTKDISRLRIPKLLKAKDIDGIKHYDLHIRKNTHNFFKDIDTKTLGINDTYLGNTLLLKDGDNVSINYFNHLDEISTMHGHGMHLPANMDGGPHQKIDINGKWSATYKVNQKACTNWYHAHLMGKTAEHVYKGLAGLIIIEDEESVALDLPKTYGIDDIPLVLQDRVFDRNGEIDYSPTRREIMHGYNGDTFIANGTINAYLDISAKEIRFRILNGSNSSIYKLAFNDNRTFKQIATDNSFLQSPVSLKELVLSPAERAEIIVDLSDMNGKSIELLDRHQGKTFLKLNVINSSIAKSKTPDQLTRLVRYNETDKKNERLFILSGRMGSFYINGKSMNINTINEKIPLGEIEIWTIKNSMPMNHNFHIHATHFIILERNGSKNNVSENEKGYKDTVLLPPFDEIKIAIKMTDYADKKIPYMYHCHFLEHEDAGMMGQFVVI